MLKISVYAYAGNAYTASDVDASRHCFATIVLVHTIATCQSPLGQACPSTNAKFCFNSDMLFMVPFQHFGNLVFIISSRDVF